MSFCDANIGFLPYKLAYLENDLNDSDSRKHFRCWKINYFRILLINYFPNLIIIISGNLDSQIMISSLNGDDYVVNRHIKLII